jgi:hypothetical protein
MRLRKKSFSMNYKVDWELKFSEDMAEGEPLLEIILTQHEDDSEGTLIFP